eukprot:SAG11_NODE_4580_length_1844_cov_1.911748_2_plen_65_part_01
MVRGLHAWLGHAWLARNKFYEFPDALNLDYGEPTEVCHETSEGVFVRKWTKADEQMNCNTCPNIT